MNTKLVMGGSALVLAAAGLAATFAPDEIASYLGIASVGTAILIQLAGAAWIAFAMVNWMAKDSLIGGIYNRPVAIGNLVHFTVGALAVIKRMTAGHQAAAFCVAAVVYAVFAIAFGWIVFRKTGA